MQGLLDELAPEDHGVSRREPTRVATIARSSSSVRSSPSSARLDQRRTADRSPGARHRSAIITSTYACNSSSAFEFKDSPAQRRNKCQSLRGLRPLWRVASWPSPVGGPMFTVAASNGPWVGPSVCPHALVSERRKGKTTAPLLTPTSHSRLPMPPAHIWPPQTRWSAWHAWLLKRPAMPKGPGFFGAAQAHRQRPAIVRFKVFDAGHQALVAESRNAIGDGGFAAAWAEGAALSTEEAIAYALRGRGERKRPSTGWESLTPTELDVVRLVAEGHPQQGHCDKAVRLTADRAVAPAPRLQQAQPDLTRTTRPGGRSPNTANSRSSVGGSRPGIPFRGLAVGQPAAAATEHVAPTAVPLLTRRLDLGDLLRRRRLRRTSQRRRGAARKRRRVRYEPTTRPSARAPKKMISAPSP